MSSLPTGTVTFLFTDIVGSTKLAQQYPDAWPTTQKRHHATLRECIEQQHGYIFGIVGDECNAAFSAAANAVTAAVAVQRALQSGTWVETGPLRVRIGLHTGKAVLGAGVYEGYLTLSYVKRLMSAAHGGQILLSHATASLLRDSLPQGVTLRDLGESRLKDFDRAEHIFQAIAPDLHADFPPLEIFEALANNLPTPLTSFIGREREMAALSQQLLGQGSLPGVGRLVTLTGPGGSGKTRLAIQVACLLVPQFRHGTWWVDLGPLRDPALVPDTVLRALGVAPAPGQPPMQALISFLRDRALLLVLDNCEHLSEACAQLVNSIAQKCPSVQVLATSREPLGVPGEQLWPVPPFPIPANAAGADAEALLSYEAVQLFVERARSQRPDFSLGPHNAAQVIEICRRLDGMPLSIELAAARVRSLDVDDILAHLQNRLRLLASSSTIVVPRHQTLRASVDWSYELLSSAERLLLRRLAVFVGGCTLAAAEAVCAGDTLVVEDILDLLARLVDRSLVVTEAGRYRFLETIREYALERLIEAGEAEVLQDRHAAYFAGYLEERYDAIISREQDQAIAAITTEVGNVRAAWDRAAAIRRYDLLHRSTRSLLWYFELLNRFYEGEAVYGRAVRMLADDPSADPNLLATLRAYHGYLLGRLGRLGDAREELERGCAQLRHADAPSELALVLTFLGTIIWQQGDFAQATALLEESLGISRMLGEKHWIALNLFFLGLVVHSTGHYAKADEYFREGLALSRMRGQPRMIPMISVSSGPTLLALGKYTEARERLQEGLALARKTQDRWLVATALGYLGIVLNAQGDNAGAKSAFQEAVALAQEFGNRWDWAWCEVGLGDANLALGDPAQAADHYRSGLKLAMEANAIPIAVDALAGFALMRAQAGDREQGSEFIAQVLLHPASSGNARARAAQARQILDPDLQRQPARTAGTFEQAVQQILATAS